MPSKDLDEARREIKSKPAQRQKKKYWLEDKSMLITKYKNKSAKNPKKMST